MGCYHPFTARSKEEGLLSRVKCGKCPYCRNRRRLQWIGRLRFEALAHEHVRFVTLTYRDDPGVLDVGQLQGFLKRFRFHHGPLRYFAVGEYGEKSGRGHWHLITFGPNLELGQEAIAEKAWPFGFHLVGTPSVASFAYVAGYALKAAPPESEKKPIVRMSLRPGIGLVPIATLAEAAARDRTPIGSWPLKFYLGEDAYPFSDGALRHFQKKYLESGGLPPASPSPEERDMDARCSAVDEGTQIQEKRLIRKEHIEGGRDAFAVSHKKARPL